ncbi:MAG TPA: VOC family protein [Deltaproteobacteria bacterium]|jgi:hypothetical protein|nr:VOC family protein [Deltaproteobacteria bacterium]HOI08394.1 VOC family protein [Deltaproteobacteria bacterium]
MVLLEDLMQAPDFRKAVDGIGSEFRKRFALPPVHQLGIAVPDVVEAAGVLEGKGIGPFFIAGGSPDFWYERYEPRGFTGTMAIAYHQGIEIELLEPGVGSDFYRQSLDADRRPVVQHLGFLVSDVDIWASVLSQAGYPVWVRGRLSAFPTSTHFAYMDTVSDTGLVMEFISWKLLGMTFSPRPGLFHAIGRVQKLTGKRVIHL